MAPDAGNDEIILLFGAREYNIIAKQGNSKTPGKADSLSRLGPV
jgi:hypothetical protein